MNRTWLTWNCTCSRIQAVCASGFLKANSQNSTQDFTVIHLPKTAYIPSSVCFPDAQGQKTKSRESIPVIIHLGGWYPSILLLCCVPGDKWILNVIWSSILHPSDSLRQCRGCGQHVLALQPPAPPEGSHNIADFFHCCCRCHFCCRCRCQLAFQLSRYCLIGFPPWTVYHGFPVPGGTVGYPAHPRLIRLSFCPLISLLIILRKIARAQQIWWNILWKLWIDANHELGIFRNGSVSNDSHKKRVIRQTSTPQRNHNWEWCDTKHLTHKYK